MSGVGLVVGSALLVGLGALSLLLWALSSGQYEDIQGDAERILIDEVDADLSGSDSQRGSPVVGHLPL